MLGYLENLSEITSKCCLAKTIVGARTIACFPVETTQKMARSATSVLPKPTSPQINLSIGFSLSVKSLSTSKKACHWNPNCKKQRKVPITGKPVQMIKLFRPWVAISYFDQNVARQNTVIIYLCKFLHICLAEPAGWKTITAEDALQVDVRI